jgi:hypothetical protein
MYNSHQEKTVMPEHDIFGRLIEPEYSEMRRTVLSRIASGGLTEDSDLSEALDSLERIELTLEAEESGVEPAVDIRTVRDFLWLCRAIDLHRYRSENRRN